MAWVGQHENERGWGPSGLIMAALVMAEVASAARLISTGGAHGGAAMIAAVGTAFASVILITLAQLPMLAKALLTLTVTATLLVLSATLDPFGMQAVNGRYAPGADDPGGPMPIAPPPSRAPMVTPVRVTTYPAGSDAAFADDLARQIDATYAATAGSPRTFRTSTSIETGPNGSTYRVSWSQSGAAGSSWCGRITTTSRSRALAIAAIARRIVDAAQSSADGGCR